MNAKIILFTLLSLFVFDHAAAAQPTKPYRIGVIHLGGVLATIVDGLRAGLKEVGLQEDKQFVLEIHDLKGDAKLAERVAQKFERDKFRLVFTTTSPVTAAAMKGTKNIPIVFAVGTDPIAQGFIKSFAQPGDRLTGIQYLARDLTAKRLELLKEFLPKLRQVVTLYNPNEVVSVEGAKLGREEARRIGVKLVERHAKTIDELTSALKSIKSDEFDAYLYVPDPVIVTQAQLIIDSARDKRLATMFHDQILVTRGALASYGQSYFEIGRHSAKYVRQVLNGASPADLRVDTIEDVEMAFNLNTAKHIGVTIPPNVLARAKKVVR
jgi:putative ABC transport system substrate-binding protein